MDDLVFNSIEEEIFFEPFAKLDIKLFFKRDDLIHPFISGNKWRKLKYHLIDAKNQHKNHLVTFGGAYSNHLLACAAAAAKYKFKISAFVRGEKVQNSILDLCQIFGMNLIFTPRDTYRDKHLLFDKYFGNDKDCYFINEGGSGNLGEIGCREIINELKENYNHIFCAAGTGTTASGIINQHYLNKNNAAIHIVSSLKGNFLGAEISKMLIHPIKYNFYDNYHFGGYAKTNDELIHFIKMFINSTGILIDPVYTGKCLFAIMDLAKKGNFNKNDKVLMIHTGGLFGILGMSEKFTH